MVRVPPLRRTLGAVLRGGERSVEDKHGDGDAEPLAGGEHLLQEALDGGRRHPATAGWREFTRSSGQPPLKGVSCLFLEFSISYFPSEVGGR